MSRSSQPKYGQESASAALVSQSRLAAAIVGAVFGVDVDELFAPSRRRRPVAKARQAAIYLVHIGFGCSLSRTGAGFSRDRTTVRHACAAIEDARDNPAFDRMMDVLEMALKGHADLSRAFATAHSPA